MKPPTVEGDGVERTVAAAYPCTSGLITECCLALLQEQALRRERSLVNGLCYAFVIDRRSEGRRSFGTRLALLTAAWGGATGGACAIVQQKFPLSLLQTNAKYPDAHSVSWHKGHAFRLGKNTTRWAPAQQSAQQQALGLERHPHQPAFGRELVPFHWVDDMKSLMYSHHS